MELAYLLFYVPVLGRLIFFFLHDGVWGVRALNRWAGRLELYLGWARDYFFIVVSSWMLGNRLWFWYRWGFLWEWPVEAVFLGLSLYARWWRWHGLAPLQELARLHPRVHPAEFFDHLYGRLGFLPHRVPLMPKRLVDPDRLDFRTGGRPKKSFWILLCGLYDTFLFATLAYKAFRWKGARAIRTTGSGLSIVWAARIAQVARMQVTVKRAEGGAPHPADKILYAVNHTSFFDFCLAPLAYRQVNADGSAKSFIPAIMVAKDHFKDNFFLYRIVGFGRMLEAWGMIFVDRKSKDPGKASRAVTLTVKKLLASGQTFSIYPQGTRARGQKDRHGERWDAGYFCVGRRDRLQKDGGHFKKGIGYIAAELALSLLKHHLAGKVWIMPIGMTGPGTACPKGSLRVQTETTVVIKVGSPLPVDPEEFRSFQAMRFQEAADDPEYQKKVWEVVQEVDGALQKLLEVRPRLERRCFTDWVEVLNGQGREEVAVAFREWRERGNLLYAILDCIYALPKRRWRDFLLELANLLRHDATKEDLRALQTRIANCF